MCTCACHTTFYNNKRTTCSLEGWFGCRVCFSASVPGRPCRQASKSVSKLNKIQKPWSMPPTPGCCLSHTVQQMALHSAPTHLSALAVRKSEFTTVQSGSGSARTEQRWHTQTMTHRLDEGLCQKQWALASPPSGKQSALPGWPEIMVAHR